MPNSKDFLKLFLPWIIAILVTMGNSYFLVRTTDIMKPYIAKAEAAKEDIIRVNEKMKNHNEEIRSLKADMDKKLDGKDLLRIEEKIDNIQRNLDRMLNYIMDKKGGG